jgi:predicted component of viral defense system (DUF524 family)
MSTNSPFIFAPFFCMSDQRNQKQQLNYKNEKSIIFDHAVCGIQYFHTITKNQCFRNRMSDAILIFRTSVRTEKDIERIGALFVHKSNVHKWNVDFEDWEKVLRIESQGITAENIIDALRTIGIVASELE